MGISLNYVTLESCDSKDNLTAVGDGGNIADSDYPQKEGSQCVEFTVKSNSSGGVKKSSDFQAFSAIDFDLTAWFLNPVVDENGDKLINDADDGIVLRLYSSSGNYADYYQTHCKDMKGEWKGGWMLLRAGGKAGTEDANSGTWTDSDAGSIVNFAIILHTDSGDSTSKNSAKFGIDWVRRHDSIIVSGDNNGDPYTMEDIYQLDVSSDGGGVWGIVNKYGNYYDVMASIVFGDGNSGKFKTSNEYINIKNLGAVGKKPVVVNSSFQLQIGDKDTSGSIDIAKNGSIIYSSKYNDGSTGEFQIDSGSICRFYDATLSNFSDVKIQTVDIEMLSSKFHESSPVILSGGETVVNVKIKDGVGSCGVEVTGEPSEFEDCVIVADCGIFVNGSGFTGKNINLSGSTKSMKFVGSDSVTVTLIDSVFDPTTIEVV